MPLILNKYGGRGQGQSSQSAAGESHSESGTPDMYAGNAPNPYEHPTMAGSSFGNPVDDNFYHPQPPIYHPSMGGSTISNQVDDVFYHS
ncbi:hypothetical protein V6N13_000853 [Hibiscus sabdariffa]